MFYWWSGLFSNPSIHCAVANIRLAWSSESACLTLNTNSNAAACCRLWHLLTLLSPAGEGHRREKLLFLLTAGRGGTVPPEADVASVMDASWLGLLGDILQSQSTYSFDFVRVGPVCWGLWSWSGSCKLKEAECAGVRKRAAAKPLHFSLINFYKPPFHLQGCFKCVFLLQTAINWNASRGVISFHKVTGMSQNVKSFALSEDSRQRLTGPCSRHVEGSVGPTDHHIQGALGFALNASAQGYVLNSEIFSLSVLHTRMSTFIIPISRAGIWGAGESETEELNPNGDCRASAGESPQAWSNQMQLRPI